MIRPTELHRRCGSVLILVVILLFAIISLAALVIDLGLVRMTQTRLQVASDAAALEGAWGLTEDLENSTDFPNARAAASDRAAQSTEFDPFNLTTATGEPDMGLGPREVILSGGVDLNSDGANDAGRLIELGNRVPAGLDLNTANSEGGDIVVGTYDAGEVPANLPLAPAGVDRFDRGDAFVPVTGPDATANSVLVRLRRTGSTDANEPGATTGGRLPVLFGVLGQFGPDNAGTATQLLAEGFAVRSESIAQLFPARAVGGPGSTGDDAQGSQLAAEIAAAAVGSLDPNANRVQPAAIPFAVDTVTWGLINDSPTGFQTANIISIDQADYVLGAALNPTTAPVVDSTGYLSITFQAPGSGTSRIVAFGMVQITAAGPGEDPVVTIVQSSGNASADLGAALPGMIGIPKTELDDLIGAADGLPGIVMAPRLVRSNRINN